MIVQVGKDFDNSYPLFFLLYFGFFPLCVFRYVCKLSCSHRRADERVTRGPTMFMWLKFLSLLCSLQRRSGLFVMPR